MEDKIVAARETGVALCDFNDDELSIATTGLIFKISAITGSQLPTHEAHINALEGELIIFLREYNSYKELTIEEVMTAFRMNAAFQFDEKIEDYGKIFNVEFVGKVLQQYCKKRNLLEYKLKDAIQEQETQEKLTEASFRRREKLQSQYILFLTRSGELDLADCYMQLKEDNGFLNPLYHKRYYNSDDEPNYNKGMGALADFFKAKMEKGFSAERKCVEDYFNELRMLGGKSVYNKAWKLNLIGFDKPLPPVEPEW